MEEGEKTALMIKKEQENILSKLMKNNEKKEETKGRTGSGKPTPSKAKK